MEQNDFNPTTIQLNEPNPNATRWVWFAGDVLSKTRKRELARLAPGGEEVQATTLVVTNGFIRKGRFTPMIKWQRAEIQEHANKNGRYQTMDRVVEGHQQAASIYSSASPFLAVPVSPAAEIGQVIESSTGARRKGIVEIKPLFGIEYADFDSTGYQKLFFDNKYDTKDFPIKLRDLVALISAAPQGDKDFEHTREILLAGCDQFKSYGESYLEAQNNLVRLPPKEGFVYQYSDVAETLFEQLEYERVDQHLNRQARSGADISEALDRLVSLQEAAAQGKLQNDNADVMAMVMAQLAEQRKQYEAEMAKRDAQIQSLSQQLTASVSVGNRNQPNVRK